MSRLALLALDRDDKPLHEQALLALDRDDKPRPTPESSRGCTMEAAEQRVERPSVSSDLSLNRE